MTAFFNTVAEKVATGPPLIEYRSDGSFEEHERLQVFERARTCAHNLVASGGVRPGDIVCLMLPTTINLIATWLGVLCARAIPTILPPPNRRQEKSLWVDNVRHVVGYTGASAVVVNQAVREQTESLFGGLNTMLLDDIELSHGDHRAEIPESSGNGPILLQHSSGTTGLQKGVALTNDHLVQQVQLYAGAIGLQPETDRIVTWLPYYHDMGLIACLVMPLLTNTSLVFMDNFAWALQPALLPRAITEHRATLCWLPNFAFNFLASRVSDGHKKDFDLSSMRLWINCSEPVKKESFERFVEHYAEQGVKPSAMASCYAMAENTFAVTQSRPGSKPSSIRLSRKEGVVQSVSGNSGAEPLWITSSGRLLPDHEISIKDASGSPLPDGHVGEIWISSPCLMDDYFAQTTTGAVKDGWYDTGDLGLIDGSELFVCGRKKDLIIVAGNNIFPEDVEAILNEIDPIQPGRVVSFGVYFEEEGTENLIALAELKAGISPLASQALRAINRVAKRRVADELGTTLRELHLLSPRTLLKSSAGKISRNRCRDLYLNTLR